jgi:hypothetical protein
VLLSTARRCGSSGLYSWRSAKNATAAEKSKQSKYVQEVAHYLPQSTLELQSFYRVSVTAGIVEEIVYRGFVLWYLALLMPMWAAVVASSLAFGVGHIYQGVNGATRAGLVGLAFAIFYVVTGSIWLPIIAHALLDIIQGATMYEILRKPAGEPEPVLEQ